MTGVKGARFVIATRMGDGTATFLVFVLKVSICPKLVNINKKVYMRNNQFLSTLDLLEAFVRPLQFKTDRNEN